jgi:hypothetical protein
VPKGHPLEPEAEPQDVLATMYQVLGVNPHQEFQDCEGRPFPILPEGVHIILSLRVAASRQDLCTRYSRQSEQVERPQCIIAEVGADALTLLRNLFHHLAEIP